jgi:hypothetical protein
MTIRCMMVAGPWPVKRLRNARGDVCPLGELMVVQVLHHGYLSRGNARKFVRELHSELALKRKMRFDSVSEVVDYLRPPTSPSNTRRSDADASGFRGHVC